jgi:hypothetical protein
MRRWSLFSSIILLLACSASGAVIGVGGPYTKSPPCPGGFTCSEFTFSFSSAGGGATGLMTIATNQYFFRDELLGVLGLSGTAVIGGQSYAMTPGGAVTYNGVTYSTSGVADCNDPVCVPSSDIGGNPSLNFVANGTTYAIVDGPCGAGFNLLTSDSCVVITFSNATTSGVPEPSSFVLLGLGIFLFAAASCRKLRRGLPPRVCSAPR